MAQDRLDRHTPQVATSAPHAAKPKRTTRLLVPRRIDVIKDDQSPDSFFRMEIDDANVVVVPIGPRLVSALIQALERTQRAAQGTPTKQ